MILGMSIETFTLVHVVISLVAIAVGIIVTFGMLGSNRMPGLTACFLLTTIATSVTGFMFPFTTLLPSHITGIISLIFLAIAVVALYIGKLSGTWRPIYAATAIVSLYLNVFVLIVQGFIKVGPLKALAPTQSEPPFLIAQGACLVLFVIFGIGAVRRFRPV